MITSIGVNVVNNVQISMIVNRMNTYIFYYIQSKLFHNLPFGCVGGSDER